MTADPGAPLESPDPGPLFASFAARVRAWLIDLAILAAILIVVIILGGFAKDVPGSGRVLLATLIAVPLLYEPIWARATGQRSATAAQTCASSPMARRGILAFCVPLPASLSRRCSASRRLSPWP
jgi:hypothetical protein